MIFMVTIIELLLFILVPPLSLQVPNRKQSSFAPVSLWERKFQAWILERIAPPRAAGFNSDLSEMDKYWV